MTNEEIKKAFNRFKKQAEKELSFSLVGRCYMNQRQVDNRTATITICCDVPYEKGIKYATEAMEAVQRYENWTSSAKAESKAEYLRDIARLEELQSKYGTRLDEATEKMDEITHSAAFDQFRMAMGYDAVKWMLEVKKQGAGLCSHYQVRLSY